MLDAQTRVGTAGILSADDIDVFAGAQNALNALSLGWITLSRGLDKEEIKADGQYSLPLEGNSEFIKPFFGNPEEGKETETKAELTSTKVESQQATSQESQSTTPQNPQGNKPETVTISQGSNTVGTAEKKEEDKPSISTKAASQVKTGIEGIGYLGIVLIVALAAYFVLLKKKKEEDK